MKALFINGSPRNDWSTAQMLKSAMKGAVEAGATAELVSLYDASLRAVSAVLPVSEKMLKRIVFVH